MPTTIGGKPIVFDDGGKVSRFMEDYQPLRHLKDFYHGYHEPRDQGSREGGKLRVGLPLDSWNDAPNIGLNELYWPTGASRFTLGYFLMRGADVAELPAPFTAPVTCVFDAVNSFSTVLYAGYRRIAVDGDLFLVALVDDRYFWQDLNVGDILVNQDSTWEALFSLVGARIGGISVDAINEEYLTPDPGELTRPYTHLGQYLDAISHSVGHRIVRLPDGVVRSMNWDSSDTIYDANGELSYLIAGGGSPHIPPIPESIDVVFQGSENRFACCSDPYLVNVTAPTYLETAPNYVRTVHSAAYADYTTNGSGGTPDNAGQLLVLAGRIALDYYRRFNKPSYDVTFQGIPQWTLSGYDDSILFRLGIPSKSGEKPDWIVNTRVQSLRYNGDPYTNLSQDVTNRVLKCGFYVAKVTEDITASVDGVPGEGKAEIYELNKGSGNLIGTDIVVDVFNISETVFAVPDEEVDEFIHIDVDGYCVPWVIAAASDKVVVVQLNADVPVWDNGEPEAEDEYEHGCETVSGEIVEPCSATVPDPATTVDVVFIRREGREPDLSSGDRIQCVPLDLTADPPRYLAVGEYLKGGEPEYFGIELREDIGETTAGEADATIYEMDFTTEIESTATVLDNGGIFEGGEDGAKGIAVKIDGEYHLIQLSCPPEES